MTETLEAPPLLRKQIDLGPPTFTIINKRLGGFTKKFVRLQSTRIRDLSS